MDEYVIISNKNSLTYPVQIGDQKITPINNTTFKSKGIHKVENDFRVKYNELLNKLEELKKEYDWNVIVYESKFSFEPITGQVYHLYEGYDGKNFLSLISPKEWSMKHIGSFKLNSELMWEKVD